MNQDQNSNEGEARSRTPHSKEFLEYISSGWDTAPKPKTQLEPAAAFAKQRRSAVAKAFEGKLVVIAAGAPKTRSNDTE